MDSINGLIAKPVSSDDGIRVQNAPCANDCILIKNNTRIERHIFRNAAAWQDGHVRMYCGTGTDCHVIANKSARVDIDIICNLDLGQRHRSIQVLNCIVVLCEFCIFFATGYVSFNISYPRFKGSEVQGFVVKNRVPGLNSCFLTSEPCPPRRSLSEGG